MDSREGLFFLLSYKKFHNFVQTFLQTEKSNITEEPERTMEKDERDLVYQAQEGNQWAFEKLIYKYDRKVLALTFQLVGDTEDAKDVYQEAFMRAYHNIKKFRFESDFYTWLYRIVVNCAISYRKKRTRQRHRSLEQISEREEGWHWMPADSGASPETLVLNAELREQIQSTMNTLPLMQRVVFILRFFQDFKIKEIAQIIGCSEGTVKNYIFRSTQKMRKHLSSYVNF